MDKPQLSNRQLLGCFNQTLTFLSLWSKNVESLIPRIPTLQPNKAVCRKLLITIIQQSSKWWSSTGAHKGPTHFRHYPRTAAVELFQAMVIGRKCRPLELTFFHLTFRMEDDQLEVHFLRLWKVNQFPNQHHIDRLVFIKGSAFCYIIGRILFISSSPAWMYYLFPYLCPTPIYHWIFD